MKIITLIILAIFVFIGFANLEAVGVEQNNIAQNLKAVPQNCSQLIITLGTGDSNADIYCFQKDSNGYWKQVYKFNGFVGKGGIGKASEGDVKSPSGYYTLGTAFGRLGNPGTKMPWRNITPNDYWDDNPNSSTYNTWQSSNPPKTERMYISAYNYGFVINYNLDRVPGAGSAIFFHVAYRYTLGCTGTSKDNVVKILKWLNPKYNPMILQCNSSDITKY